VLLRTSVITYFKDYSDTEQSFTYPTEKLVETVGAAVTLMELGGGLASSDRAAPTL
jgi:hypothetical protein